MQLYLISIDFVSIQKFIIASDNSRGKVMFSRASDSHSVEQGVGISGPRSLQGRGVSQRRIGIRRRVHINGM